MSLGGRGTDIQSRAARTKPLPSVPKSYEMFEDCKQLVSPEGPSCTTQSWGSSLSEGQQRNCLERSPSPEALGCLGALRQVRGGPVPTPFWGLRRNTFL